MKIKKKQEEGDNLDRWLLTYADLITLLLGLFVILYSISKVDVQKYQQAAKEMKKIFGTGATILPGQTLAIVHDTTAEGGPKEGKGKMDSLMAEIQKSLEGLSESSSVTFEENQFGLVLRFKERLLFELGKADLKPVSFPILNAVAQKLKEIPNDILIEGHTDTIPINNDQFPSNMHLSSYRAINTSLYLTEVSGLSVDRISIRGCGEFKPLLPNTSDSNRAKNRRVDIIIVEENKKAGKAK